MSVGPLLRWHTQYRAAALSTLLALSQAGLGLAPAQADSAPSDDLAAAHRAIEKADWKAAEGELRQSLALHPATPDPHFLLAYVLFREQHAANSLAEYTAAARLRTPTADELVVVASDYILLKDYPDAERWLVYATGQSPAIASAWYLLGRTQFRLDHAAAAAASFRRCLELSPGDVRAEYNLGLALEKLDRPADAESAYRTAIRWQENASLRDPQPFLDLGMLLLSQHHADRALPPLREASDLAPKNALAYQELGLAFEALSQNTEAVAALERATILAPDAEQPHFLLGRVYRRLGRTSAAAAQFAEVQRIAGSHSDKETPNPVQLPTSAP